MVGSGILLAAACADGTRTIEPGPDELVGFIEVETNDTVPAPPPGEAPTTPGSFHGVVLGYGTGPDTMATAPRLEGVVVTAYPHLGWDGNNPLVGESVGSVTTDANGEFQFPEIPGGDYIVTFVPPAGSGYRQTYTQAQVSSMSNEGSWWIFLPPAESP